MSLTLSDLHRGLQSPSQAQIPRYTGGTYPRYDNCYLFNNDPQRLGTQSGPRYCKRYLLAKYVEQTMMKNVESMRFLSDGAKA